MSTRMSDFLKAGSRRLRKAIDRNLASKAAARPFSEENIGRYCPGGYHPVRLQDVFHNGRYQVVSKLGYGRYSTVWLARDTRSNKHVALKILTADSFGGAKDTFELDILAHINNNIHDARPSETPGANHILHLLDWFRHHGPNGTHTCLVFKAMGPDLSEYRRLFPECKIPHHLLNSIAKQLLLALAYLHETCRIIHTDIKPQNILVETPELDEMFEQAPSEVFKPNRQPHDPPNDFYMDSEQITSATEDLAQPRGLSVRLSDFGTASWYDKHLTEWIQPEKLRAPEVILGAGWNHKVDIWNLGLIIWELAEAQILFDGQETPTASYSSAAHLAQMSAVFGPMPKNLLSRSDRASQYFDAEGNALSPNPFSARSLVSCCKSFEYESFEKENFLEFLRSMLRLSPEARLDAPVLLCSKWLRDA